MIAEGMVVLVAFPQVQTDLPGKVRPAVLIQRLPGGYDDWLICMVSSRVAQSLDGFDDIVSDQDDDVATS